MPKQISLNEDGSLTVVDGGSRTDIGAWQIQKFLLDSDFLADCRRCLSDAEMQKIESSGVE